MTIYLSFRYQLTYILWLVANRVHTGQTTVCQFCKNILPFVLTKQPLSCSEYHLFVFGKSRLSVKPSDYSRIISYRSPDEICKLPMKNTPTPQYKISLKSVQFYPLWYTQTDGLKEKTKLNSWFSRFSKVPRMPPRSLWNASRKESY
jgi:hypothetical protein